MGDTTRAAGRWRFPAIGTIALLLFQSLVVRAAEWQWSVPLEKGRAFLWVPPACTNVRAVVLAQHNMIEEGILEHPAFRRELAQLGFAEVWIVPPMDVVFQFDQGAGEKFDAILKSLADASGCGELATAPVAPMGHSACASFVWNYGAWNPGRTLAMLSVKGDAPQTTMTGSGRPSPAWGDRKIDGVPGLMVMGEYEWVEGRLAPAIDFQRRNPRAPLAMLAIPGRGHFDIDDRLVNFLALFLRKAAEARLPREAGGSLRPVDSAAGWRCERWYFNKGRNLPPAPRAEYLGDETGAFWCFDEEMARATWAMGAEQPARRPQLVDFARDGQALPETSTHFQVRLDWRPAGDDLAFKVEGVFLDQVAVGCGNLPRWTCLPVGAPLGHASGGGPIRFERITGPVAQTGPDTFELRLNRTCMPTDRRWLDVWLLASHPGDGEYKSAVQQALLTLKPPAAGAEQSIEFDPIPDVHRGTDRVALKARSSAGAPVRFYVREGPAEVDGDVVKLLPLPPRAKRPITVTIVAWQWGRDTEPKLKMAAPVERSFTILE